MSGVCTCDLLVTGERFSVAPLFRFANKQRYFFSNPFADDAVSMTSSLGVCDLDDEDEDLRAAVSRLNEDQPGVGDGEERCDEERRGATEEERDSPNKRPSLEALLGPLPTAASLGLSDSIQKCVGEEKENENENGEEPRLGVPASRSVQIILA